MAYVLYIGCEEWQDVTAFESLEQAKERADYWKNEDYTMGAYKADEAYIENDAIDYYESLI